MRARLAVAVALVVGMTSGSARAQDAGPAAPVSETETLARQITGLKQHASAIEAKIPTLSKQLTDVESKLDNLGGSVASEQKLAAELVVAARRQIIGAYVRGDASNEPLAFAAALSQRNTNDAAWSLTLIQVANRRTIDLMRAARTRGFGASKELTAAIEARDKIREGVGNAARDAAAIRSQIRETAEKLTVVVAAQAPLTIEGMTTLAYDAYRKAAVSSAASRPDCGLRWELLAAIGRTESGHGSGRLDATGTARPPILGISIGPDTDKGEIDTDPGRDHAVGPMQFIPQTWRRYATDGNGDGKADINNIYDQSLAAANYLCVAASKLTLTTKEGVAKAILAYNPNQEYLRTVGERFEALAQDSAKGWFSSEDLPDVTTDDTTGATGGGTPIRPPSPAATPNTEVRVLTVFGATTPAVPVVAGDPLPGVCSEASIRLKSRTGLLRCTVGTQALDPCIPASYDLTLVACLPDPEKAAQLVRTAAPVATAEVRAAPPYFLVVLQGGDRCQPSVGTAAYTCASGAEITSQPNANNTFWLATVRQPGIAARQVPIARVIA